MRHITQRKLLAAASLVVVALSLMYVTKTPGHIPPYDADLVRLAENQLQGYCAGDTFWKSQGAGDASMAYGCRNRYAHRFSHKPDLRAVQPAFCQAIVVNGWEGTLEDCLAIMTQNQYWPTRDGGITNQWNRARPYPLTFGSSSVGTAGSGSRTGGAHGGGSRSNSPTHSTPYYP